jgi:hypothetical protein
MSGALDMNYTKFKINEAFAQSLKDRFQKLLGTSDVSQDVFFKNSVVNMAEMIKANNLPVTIDCGVDDFLIEVNRELHRRLVYNGTPHDLLSAQVRILGSTGKILYHIMYCFFIKF